MDACSNIRNLQLGCKAQFLVASEKMKKKIAIVTGGSSGIGLAICERLLAEGMEVHAISRNPNQSGSINYFIRFNWIFPTWNQSLDSRILLLTKTVLLTFWSTMPVMALFTNGRNFRMRKSNGNYPFCSRLPFCCAKRLHLMQESGKGAIVNITSLATLFPLPFMPLYNAGKSGLSSFTQSLMLEYPQYPKLIDFRLGGVRTSFNQSAPKQFESKQPRLMKKAWRKIESQLDDSPAPASAVIRMMEVLRKKRSGVFYGGGFFQSRVSPLIYRIMPFSLLQFVLKVRYGLS